MTTVNLDLNALTSALLDAHDIRNSLAQSELDRLQKADVYQFTIGDALDELIEFLEGLEITALKSALAKPSESNQEAV